MNRRAKLQLRLQQTVEGLSVAAITYYVVGLVGYAAKGLKALGVTLDPEVVTALSVLPVALLVGLGIHRIRQIVTRRAGAGMRRPHAVVIGAGFGGLAAARAAGGAGLPGHGAGAAGGAGRAGSRASAGRVHLRCRAHHHHRPLPARGAVGAGRSAACATRWSCGRSTRSTGSASTTGRPSTYSGDPDAMRAEVARFAPDDVPGYERFMALSEAICRIGFEQLGHVPFGSWRDMARIVPDLLRLQGYRSVHGLVASCLRDPRLRTVFSFHPLLIGGNPFTTTSIYCLIAFLERRWGVHYAVGGMGRLVQGLVGLIEGQGGEVRCGAEVEAIALEGRRATGVRLAGGRDGPGRHRGLERLLGLDLPAPASRPRRGAAGPTGGSAVPATR